MQDLTTDMLLTTTRAVRKRLDFSRPVSQQTIRECIEIALQAPTGGYSQNWHFVVVEDPEKRKALAEIYRRGWALYRKSPGSIFHEEDKQPTGARKEQLSRVIKSADYLAENLEHAPVHVIPCVGGRMGQGSFNNAACASVYGSVIPATWSYMLAARCRGLGTCWTTAHLINEQAAAELLDIPYDRMTQIALIPTAHTLGHEFRPAPRKPIEDVVHFDQW